MLMLRVRGFILGAKRELMRFEESFGEILDMNDEAWAFSRGGEESRSTGPPY